MNDHFKSAPEGAQANIKLGPFTMDRKTVPCPSEAPPAPCIIVIIGASGDLTSRKLAPALYRLFIHNSLPSHFIIVGCSRTELDSQGFREKIKEAVSTGSVINQSQWEQFAEHIYYQVLNYDTLQSFTNLGIVLQELDRTHATGGNRIFYLAIPPILYKDVARMISQAGLSCEKKQDCRSCRIVVEKPFGSDLQTAIELNQILREGFGEHQIYRIDHYLAKETVQNVMVFRFANAIFEPLWMRNYIDYVSIIAAESIGVEHRAGYYETSGVLRDMFQNHMMQLLAMTAMEPASHFEADQVRDEAVKVFRSLRPFPRANPWENLVLGQYRDGVIDGKTVCAYREEPGVNPHSLTPTFGMMRVFIDNWRWQGVPFYLTSGKRLPKKLTEIAIQFKEVPHSVFHQTLGEHISANRLILGIQPDEKITLTFQTKNPGARVCLRSVTMDFSYSQNYTGPMLDAYEKVLLDCMNGDQMLFWRQDAVELCWSFLTPVLETCESCGEREAQLNFYASGTWGPAAAKDLVNLLKLERR